MPAITDEWMHSRDCQQSGLPVWLRVSPVQIDAGVIAAAALKCMGGNIQGRLWPRNEDEKTRALEAGYDLEKV